MVYWPIHTLVDSGIDEILLVCGGNAAGEFLRILGNGEEFGLSRLNYAYQSEPKGIADALKKAKEWAGDDSIAVILSDNIFEDTFSNSIKEFENAAAECKLFITEVEKPEWYGVVELGKQINNSYQVNKIVEKPKIPKSNMIATGLYMYKSTIWNYIDDLSESARGELEITDLNNIFINKNKLVAEKLNGYWGDAGESIDVYLNTCIKWSNIIKERK